MPRSKRQYAQEAERDEFGRLKPADPLARFAGKCAFDPTTGCVMWIGTTTHGHGRNEPYGYFWFEGKMWLAHRWAAHFIHGFDIDELEVDHCCPCGPSTLCVHHIEPRTGEDNRALRHTRTPRPAAQAAETKRFWLFIHLGIEEYTPRPREVGDVPFYEPPAWLRPFLLKSEAGDDCPF